jgi:hypothetical protein
MKDHLGKEVVVSLIENASFVAGSVVEMDGKHFRKCAFGNGCVIQFTGGPYMFEKCSFGTPMHFRLGGPAATTLSLIQMLCDNLPEMRSELLPNWKTWKEYDEKTIVQ